MAETEAEKRARIKRENEGPGGEAGSYAKKRRKDYEKMLREAYKPTDPEPENTSDDDSSHKSVYR